MVDFEQLDERQIYRLLSRLALELRAGLNDEQAELVADEADARQLVAAVAAGLKIAASPVNAMKPSAAARRVVALLAQDPALQARLEALAEPLTAPTRRSQPGRVPAAVEPQDVIALILNAVAAWLQARLLITAEAEDYRVDLDSSETGLALIEAVVTTVLSI